MSRLRNPLVTLDVTGEIDRPEKHHQMKSVRSQQSLFWLLRPNGPTAHRLWLQNVPSKRDHPSGRPEYVWQWHPVCPATASGFLKMPAEASWSFLQVLARVRSYLEIKLQMPKLVGCTSDQAGSWGLRLFCSFTLSTARLFARDHRLIHAGTDGST